MLYHYKSLYKNFQVVGNPIPSTNLDPIALLLLGACLYEGH
jgi:hypothetical protein